ncbi:hypothetical protein REPUB_Repub13aG0038300 [Reevesia pubescens]
MARLGHGSKGDKIYVPTNHFKVNDGKHFLHYYVSFKDGRPVGGESVGRKVIDRVHKTYNSELVRDGFAYDGEKSLFTVRAPLSNKLEFIVVLDDFSSNSRNNRNASPDGHESPNEHGRKGIKMIVSIKSL